MKVRWIQPEEGIGGRRGAVVVCIPVFGAHDYFVGCLRSVLAHTPADVPILICDDASPDLRSQEFVRALEREGTSEHELFYARRDHNVGFPANVNGAFASSAPADVALVNSDCVVAAGWLDGLRAAAYSDSATATATALTNHGSVVSVPDRGVPSTRLPLDWSLEDAAAAIQARSLRLYPKLPTAVGHCVYVRRSALDLVGGFDLAFTPGYGEEVDFSQRCLHSGLSHVAADDVLVLHHGGRSLAAGGTNPLQEEHERMIAARYPYYHDAVREAEINTAAPLARALGVARRALTGLSVVIDARILSGPMTGTQLHVLELIAAVARTGEARVRAIVPRAMSDYAQRELEALPDVELMTLADGMISAPAIQADLVHRPFQISTPADFSVLARCGDRLVITQQDLIGYRNPGYFRTFRKWEGYRSLTRRALASADRVLFFSAHARDDALSEDLIEPHRASVVHIGVDHRLTRAARVPVPPRDAERIPPEAEVMLCLGTDFRHKNRIFALRVLEALQRCHDWRGWLVFAGPRVNVGSSVPEEDRLVTLQPRLAEAVLDMAAVSEAEKLWLLRRANLVVYPTVHEGFGLIPFEAADQDTPCLWAPGTSLSEILPDEAAGIIPWDPVATAAQALELMRNEHTREQNLAAVRRAAAPLQWDSTARQLLELYNRTCDLPATPASTIERGQGLMRGGVSEDVIRLFGPEGVLTQDMERPLLALATHPRVGSPLFRAIKAGYRASYRMRRLGGQTDDTNGAR